MLDSNHSPINLGAVGAGFIAQVAHLPNFSQFYNCRLQALAEWRTGLNVAVCSRYGIPKGYKHHSEMLESESLDAVAVVTRRTQTGQIVLDFLNRGISVFSEKPMAQTYEDALVLASAAESNRCVYSVGFMRRYDPAVRKAKQIISDRISSGELGRPLFMSMSLIAGDDYCGIDGDIKSQELKPPDGTWRRYPAWCPPELGKAYESFVNVAGHNINLLNYFFDDDEAIVQSANLFSANHGQALLTISSIPATFTWAQFTGSSRWKETFALQFEHGNITLELVPAFLRNVPCRLREERCGRPGICGETIDYHFDWHWSFKVEDFEFIRAVEENAETVSSGISSLRDYIIIDGIWRRIIGAC